MKQTIPTSADEVAKISQSFQVSRVSKQYTLQIGTIPEKADKVNRFNKHVVVICCAIANLVNEGTTSATRDDIMKKAVALGLYDEKAGQPSKQAPDRIFSWNQPAVKLAGFIA